VHYSTAFGKLHHPLLSAALQHRLTAALCHRKYTYGHLLSIQVRIHPKPMHCSTAFDKLHHPLLNAALQNRLTAGLITANTPMDICSPYKREVSQTQCTIALLLANCITHCSVLLCNTG